jgi:DNA-binding NarL/FixJ family response regulator
MDKQRINIAIAEPSDIVYEGLFNLLMKWDNSYYIYRITSLNDLMNYHEKVNFSSVIINPSIIQNKNREFQKLRKQFIGSKFLALVYSIFEDSLLNLFDSRLSINDGIEIIASKILDHSYSIGDEDQSISELTEREKEVLILLTQGLANKEIADKLHISVHTVISHRKNISERTGIKSLSGLTIYAISKNIIPIV